MRIVQRPQGTTMLLLVVFTGYLWSTGTALAVPSPKQQRSVRSRLLRWRSPDDGTTSPSSKSSSSSSPLSYNSVFGSPSSSTTTTQPSPGYVPDGLSAAEYQQLKRQEAAQAAQADYGAWGPRFRRTATPDGDWFLMRNLWTTGAVGNASSFQQQPSYLSSTSPRRRFFVYLVLQWMLVEGAVLVLTRYQKWLPPVMIPPVERFLRLLSASSSLRTTSMRSQLVQRLPTLLTALAMTTVPPRYLRIANPFVRYVSKTVVTLLTGMITYMGMVWGLARLVG